MQISSLPHAQRDQLKAKVAILACIRRPRLVVQPEERAMRILRSKLASGSRFAGYSFV